MNFNDSKIADILVKKIRSLAAGMDEVRLMELCGTHTMTIARHGLRHLLPENIKLLSGPGCPVCVTTQKEIDEAVALAEKGITVTCFGDMLRVKGSVKSLEDAKTCGCDVKVVYSISDARRLAEDNPGREVSHMAIGFETTTPPTAIEVQNAPDNFSVLSCHKLFPPAMKALLDSEVKIDGFINPGHVSSIIGLAPYEEFKVPQVVAGFEALDVLAAIEMLLQMIKDGKTGVVNEYSRVVKPVGNLKAQRVMHDVFDVVDVSWRGFPVIPKSGLVFKKGYSRYDARKKYNLKIKEKPESNRGCRCGEVLRGIIPPRECPLFAKACNPEKPCGPCMVSIEGACHNTFKYER